MGVVHVFRTVFDVDAVFTEDVGHVEPGDTGKSGGFAEVDLVVLVQVNGCREAGVFVGIEIVPDRMANGGALIFEDAGLDAPFDELMKVV